MSEINLVNDLFLCPVFFDADPCTADGKPLPLNAEDMEVHFTAKASEMLSNGSKVILTDKMPDGYGPAKEVNRGIMHMRKIDSPDGQSFIPLFTSYQAMVNIFGKNIHVGVISFEDARTVCREDEDLAGIAIAPGRMNQIIPREALV